VASYVSVGFISVGLIYINPVAVVSTPRFNQACTAAKVIEAGSELFVDIHVPLFWCCADRRSKLR